MRKIIEVIFAAAIILLATVPLVTSSTGTATASVTVNQFCDISVSPDVNFGSLNPGRTSLPQTTTVSEPTGNTVNVGVSIDGTAWTGGTGMPVTQTKWNSTSSTLSTSLTTSPVSIVDQIGPGSPQNVNLAVVIPVGQAAAAYTQTITFTGSC